MPETMLRASAVVPPMVLLLDPTQMPDQFPATGVPLAFVPM